MAAGSNRTVWNPLSILSACPPLLRCGEDGFGFLVSRFQFLIPGLGYRTTSLGQCPDHVSALLCSSLCTAPRVCAAEHDKGIAHSTRTASKRDTIIDITLVRPNRPPMRHSIRTNHFLPSWKPMRLRPIQAVCCVRCVRIACAARALPLSLPLALSLSLSLCSRLLSLMRARTYIP